MNKAELASKDVFLHFQVLKQVLPTCTISSSISSYDFIGFLLQFSFKANYRLKILFTWKLPILHVIQQEIYIVTTTRVSTALSTSGYSENLTQPSHSIKIPILKQSSSRIQYTAEKIYRFYRVAAFPDDQTALVRRDHQLYDSLRAVPAHLLDSGNITHAAASSSSSAATAQVGIFDHFLQRGATSAANSGIGISFLLSWTQLTLVS